MTVHMQTSLTYFPPGAGNLTFSLKNTTYQNNSLVALEDIGEGDDALLCITELTACCQPPYTGEMEPDIGNWFFPNGTRVPDEHFNVTSGLYRVGFLQNQRSQYGTYAQEERW